MQIMDLANVSHSIPRSSPLDDDFSEFVTKTLGEWHVPGMAIGVVDGDGQWHQGYGLCDISHKSPVTSHTLFYAGSLTKAFTAAGVATLVADADLPDIDWRTPICSLIREDFVVGDAWTTSHLTLEDILTHRTGLPAHDQAHGRQPSKHTPQDDKPRAAVREVTRQLRQLPVTTEPRAQYQYCNIMYVAASHIVESLTGQWLGTVLREKIFKPLKMEKTYFATEDALDAPQVLANGYRYDPDTDSYVEIPPMDLDGTSGAGSLITCVEDYTHWMRAVMEQHTIFNVKQWNELSAPRTIIDAGQEPFTGPNTYALGWRVSVYKGHKMLHHTGAMHAFGALVVLLPDVRYGVIAFANTAGSSVFAAYNAVWRLLDERLGVPVIERFDWDAKNRHALQSGIAHARAAPSRLYPGLPGADSESALPLTLPLAAYAGTYYDAGYQTLTLCVTDTPPSAFLQRFIAKSSDEEWLVAHRKELTWPERLTLQHVAADYFIAWAEHEGDYGAWYPEAYPVRFDVGADASVKGLEIGWEVKMGHERIQMRRVVE